MAQLKTARAYVNALSTYSEDEQAADVMTYAAAQGWECTISRESEEGRDSWLRLLRGSRNTHVALLPRLDVLLIRGKPWSERPTSGFISLIAEIMGLAPLVVDVGADVTSANAKAFAVVVKAATERVTNGRDLPRRIAREMAEKRWDRTPRGAVDDWLSPWRAKDLKLYGSIWRDAGLTSDKGALNAVNAQLVIDEKAPLGSTSTARRIFGVRRPKAKKRKTA